MFRTLFLLVIEIQKAPRTRFQHPNGPPTPRSQKVLGEAKRQAVEDAKKATELEERKKKIWGLFATKTLPDGGSESDLVAKL